MFTFNSSITIVIQVRETTVFLYGNFELKHVTIVTDLNCIEKPGPDVSPWTESESLHKNVIVVVVFPLTPEFYQKIFCSFAVCIMIQKEKNNNVQINCKNADCLNVSNALQILFSVIMFLW